MHPSFASYTCFRHSIFHVLELIAGERMYYEGRALNLNVYR